MDARISLFCVLEDVDSGPTFGSKNHQEYYKCLRLGI
jgi:hypothetical protein